MNPTRGEAIAKEFSVDKVHLTDAEQRRLAQMIDNADDAPSNGRTMRCPTCQDSANKYPDGECQHGFLYN